MKVLFKHLGAAAALATVTAPVAASARPTVQPVRANPAAPLSVGTARTGSVPADASRLRGDNSTLINLGIFAAIVVGVLLATTTGGDDDDTPDSQ